MLEGIGFNDDDGYIFDKKVVLRQLTQDAKRPFTDDFRVLRNNMNQIKYIPRKPEDIGAMSMKTWLDDNNVFTGHFYADNARGKIFTTRNFDGSGNYVKLEKQFVTGGKRPQRPVKWLLAS